MEWRTIRVDDRAEIIGVLGRGSPLVFLHGWGLTPRIYRHALARLARNFRVYAPVIPGFVGVPDRPPDERTLGGYSTWLRQILDAAGIGPVTLVGHSLGGAIAIRAAHDLPDRVSRLVLVNSVGGGSRSGGGGEERPIRERPLWEWGAAALREALSRSVLAPTPASLPNARIPYAFCEPGAVWRTADIARSADLTPELDRLAQRGLPVSLLWGRGDRLIPRASFESLRDALRTPPVFTVAGGHGWLITDPKYFGHAMRTVLNWIPPKVAA
ncbi:alpha/beta hydrolase [Rhodococcus sp. ACS1]|uniref:alpha/beta fold hydrolase n=1 Tax=Rhodococcus sp. ACS1 TaxID=2028570 RepID=UPI000BB145EA|nr:alpha/beta hydrolase [Rhodococcus sp. ACS1]PBC39636.1 alpha/beta hydrolase [Rhodococcus sp. ACS1]